MNARICAALLLSLTSAETALAAERNPVPNGPPGLFQGTAQERAACRTDASRFCSSEFPDTFRVLACLQARREKLRTACRQVLETNGQ